MPGLAYEGLSQLQSHSPQPGVHSKLWGSVAEWEDDFDRVRRIHGESNHQQTLCEKQHMCWTQRGAHMLLQVRTSLK
jgi:hypothetical protein